jgi:hypothetical protein
MTVCILPFPLARRRDFVRRHAARMAELPPATAEKHLIYQLRVQAETMQRRGIAPDLISAHISSLETVIRCELWRRLILEGGAA